MTPGKTETCSPCPYTSFQRPKATHPGGPRANTKRRRHNEKQKHALFCATLLIIAVFMTACAQQSTGNGLTSREDVEKIYDEMELSEAVEILGYGLTRYGSGVTYFR